MKTRKMLAGGLLKTGIKLIYKDPKSRKALKLLRDLGKSQGVSRSEINTTAARGLKKFTKLIESRIKTAKFSRPDFKKKGTKIMRAAKKELNLFLKKQKSKKQAMQEGLKATKHFKGGLMIKPKLAQKGF